MESDSIFPSLVDFLNGKKVIIFDTETSGLPMRNPGGKFGTREEYWDYFNNDAYENSRILSIAWYYTDNFQRHNLDTTKINNYIRKPDTFINIDPESIKLHGITLDIANELGIPFQESIDKDNNGLGCKIEECVYIVAHNVMFDIHILMNELYRINKFNCIDKIKTMLNTGKCICTGQIGKNVCKLNYKSQLKWASKKNNANYKMPKLKEFYLHIFGKEPEDQHSAGGDVKALIEIITNI